MLRIAILSPSPLYHFCMEKERKKGSASSVTDWGRSSCPLCAMSQPLLFPKCRQGDYHQLHLHPHCCWHCCQHLLCAPLAPGPLCNDNQRPWRSEPCAGHPPHLLLLTTSLLFPHFFFYLHETEHHGGRPNIAKGEC